MKATPSRVTAQEIAATHSGLTDVSWAERGLEADARTRVDDALALGVATLLAIGGLFISWVLLAPKALDVLK